MIKTWFGAWLALGLSVLLLAQAGPVLAIPATQAGLDMMHGMCYSPTPSDFKPGSGVYYDSDFTNDSFSALWGMDTTAGVGRQDIKNLHDNLHVNVLRLYDWNTPSARNHVNFLNEAASQGIKVMIPISNYFMGLTQNNDPKARTFIESIVAEAFEGNKPRSAALFFSIGNEFSLNGISADTVATVSEWVVRKQDALGVAAADRLFITAPVDFGVHGDPHSRPAIVDLVNLKNAFAANSYLSAQNIYRDKYVAGINTFNDQAYLTSYLSSTFASALPDTYVMATELGKSASEVGGDRNQQATWLQGQISAFLTSSNSKVLGACAFHFFDQPWKGGSEGTFGIQHFDPSKTAVTVGSGANAYLMDYLKAWPAYQKVADAYK